MELGPAWARCKHVVEKIEKTLKNIHYNIQLASMEASGQGKSNDFIATSRLLFRLLKTRLTFKYKLLA